MRASRVMFGVLTKGCPYALAKEGIMRRRSSGRSRYNALALAAAVMVAATAQGIPASKS